MTTDYHFSTEAKLQAFVRAALGKVGVSPGDAAIVADVLVASDVRGIESHGVARLQTFYVDRIRAGTLDPAPKEKIVRETPTSIVLDAGNGLGHPAGKRAMLATIEKAKTAGVAFGAVRNSNHYGIAGYYAMLALEHDMIGIAATNTALLAAPTFGKEPLIGTNPWAYAVPASQEPPFVLDFATTTVPRGKLEVYARKGLPLRAGWAIDADGNPTIDADAARSGALLPLGGFGVDNGGHKGYGLGLLVELMCGVLAGGTFGRALPLPDNVSERGAISHFCGAIKIDGFRDPDAFKKAMDRELRSFKDAQRAPGVDRIYVAGEIEHEKTEAHRRDGVPIHAKVWSGLERLAAELDVPFELAR